MPGLSVNESCAKCGTPVPHFAARAFYDEEGIVLHEGCWVTLCAPCYNGVLPRRCAKCGEPSALADAPCDECRAYDLEDHT